MNNKLLRHEGRGSAAAKAAARWQFAPHWRLELGLGAADSADGRGVNADLAVTRGTLHPDRHWNFHTSLRAGASRGRMGHNPFDFDCEDDAEPEEALLDATFDVTSFGGESWLATDRRLVCEAGVCLIDPEHRTRATLFYVAAGLIFEVSSRP